MKLGYKSNNAKAMAKGYANKVSVVNTPTVKIDHGMDKEPMPTLHLTSQQLPALKKWKVGGKYMLELEVEQTSMRKGNYSDDDSKKISAEFKITKVTTKGSDYAD